MVLYHSGVREIVVNFRMWNQLFFVDKVLVKT